MANRIRHPEYLRRNLIHASSVGVVSNTRAVIDRLSKSNRHPKWLLDAMGGILDRAEPLPSALAEYRNSAPDAPTLTPANKEKE
jgi:hypothetical protein